MDWYNAKQRNKFLQQKLFEFLVSKGYLFVYIENAKHPIDQHSFDSEGFSWEDFISNTQMLVIGTNWRKLYDEWNEKKKQLKEMYTNGHS